MPSTFTAVVLVTFGLMSLVTARPTVNHQHNVNEQHYQTFFPQQQASKDLEGQADAATIHQMADAYNSMCACLFGLILIMLLQSLYFVDISMGKYVCYCNNYRLL